MGYQLEQLFKGVIKPYDDGLKNPHHNWAVEELSVGRAVERARALIAARESRAYELGRRAEWELHHGDNLAISELGSLLNGKRYVTRIHGEEVRVVTEAQIRERIRALTPPDKEQSHE